MKLTTLSLALLSLAATAQANERAGPAGAPTDPVASANGARRAPGGPRLVTVLPPPKPVEFGGTAPGHAAEIALSRP